MKIITEKTDVGEAGAIIENGHIQAYKTVDMSGLIDHVQKLREVYDPTEHRHFHHLARLDYDVIENIRITNKFPVGVDGFNMAVKEAARMVKSGELAAFRIHGA